MRTIKQIKERLEKYKKLDEESYKVGLWEASQNRVRIEELEWILGW